MHWSALILIALLTEVLADAALPEAAPGHTTAAYWAAGTLGSVLLLVGLLAHEFAHVRTAQRAGLGVSSVTLWLMGGVSELAAEPDDPRTELRVALAGPLCSLAAAAGLAVLGAAAGAAGAAQLVVDAVVWAAGANALLGVFNLLPGSPLDGGRVLHALLWKRHGDQRVATATAARAGRAIGWVLGTLGVVQLVATGTLGGLWLLLLGWFIAGSADAEARSRLNQDVFAGLRVGDVMTGRPVTVGSWWTLDEVIERAVRPTTFSAYPVVDLDGAAVGLLRLRAVEAAAPGHRMVLTVRQVCVPAKRCVVLDAASRLADALPRLARLRPDDLALVCVDGRLVGVLNPRDLGRLVHRATLLHTS
jgi:Zn-dependent protease